MKSARMLAALLVTVVVCSFATPAQAALTRSQKFAKAAGQAAFGCFVYQCSGRRVLGVSGPSNGLMTYKWRLYGMQNLRGRAYTSRCDRIIKVSFQGTVSYSTYYNCA